jgi:hypothetical protein
VFNASDGLWQGTWQYAGRSVPVKSSFIYLGICFNATGSLSKFAAEHRVDVVDGVRSPM